MHFRCILLQISHKKCFFISISILGRSGDNMGTDTLARSLYYTDFVTFRKYVRSMNSSSIPLATKVGDAIGNKNIIKFRQNYFATLLNSVFNTDSNKFVCEHIERRLSGFNNATVPGFLCS